MGIINTRAATVRLRRVGGATGRRACMTGERYYGAPLLSKGRIFPYADVFEVAERRIDSRAVLRVLAPFLTSHRKQILQKVVANRTFSVLPVVDGLINSGNVAAVMRTADGLGYGALHCIAPKGSFRKLSERCSAGADKWLHVQNWTSAEDCLTSLRRTGYRVVATDMSTDAVGIEDVDWTRPTAVVFGNEGYGVSREIVAAADQRAVIRMDGFVESFNISVAAALVLYEARRSRLFYLGRHGDLSVEDQRTLLAAYYLRQQVCE